MRSHPWALIAAAVVLLGVSLLGVTDPGPVRVAGPHAAEATVSTSPPVTVPPPTTTVPVARVVPVRASRAATAPRVAQARPVFDDATKQRVVDAIYSHPWNASRMLAIARCESGLDPWARNGKHVGIFQIANATPGLIEEHVALAFRMWQQRGTSPWVQCGG